MKKWLWSLCLLILLASCGPATESASSTAQAPASSEAISNQTENISDSESKPPEMNTPPLRYEEYFSEEREFVRNETDLIDSHFACSLEDNELSVKDMKTGLVTRPIKEQVRTFWRYGNMLYIQGFDTGIMQYDLETQAAEVLYAENDVDSLYLNPDVAFFVEGSTSNRFSVDFDPETSFRDVESKVHRFHLPSKTDEVIYAANGIVKCEPITNLSIEFAIDNPEYISYLEETEDFNNNANIQEWKSFRYHAGTQTLTPYDPWTEVPEHDKVKSQIPH